ncbi:aldo/keto reductase [Streptomyces turgidiscabies]|uniref:aldo/keto reductase n=1 Tax=Streptomyces turgidiscabies TaxID=85558 RepID=UPI0038F65992
MNQDALWAAPGHVALGTFEFGSSIPATTAMELMDVHHHLGGRIIDTAPTYGPTALGCRSEQVISRWLRSRRLPAGVVTKAGLNPARPACADLDPAGLIRSAHQSAERLGTPLAGLVLHRDDPAVPVDELADACNRLVADGTAHRIGASNWTTRRLSTWIAHAEARRLARPQITQPLWSLARRTHPCPEPWLVEADDDHLALAVREQLTVMPYRTLAAGYLAAHHSGRHTAHHTATYDTPANAARRDRLRAAATALGVPVESLALACLRADTAAHVLPVTGARTVRQLRQTMSGVAAADQMTADLHTHLVGAGR